MNKKKGQEFNNLKKSSNKKRKSKIVTIQSEKNYGGTNETEPYSPELQPTVVCLNVNSVEAATRIKEGLNNSQNEIIKVVLISKAGETIDIDLKPNKYSTLLVSRGNTVPYHRATAARPAGHRSHAWRQMKYEAQQKSISIRSRKSSKHRKKPEEKNNG